MGAPEPIKESTPEPTLEYVVALADKLRDRGMDTRNWRDEDLFLDAANTLERLSYRIPSIIAETHPHD